jgi:glycosyltransferase involved in cell wall biosynthesis
VRLAVWSPLPPSPSGIADYVAEQLPLLTERVDVQVVVEDAAAAGAVETALRARYDVATAAQAGAADLDLYHLGNSPAHAYVYRAALNRPGVAVLHEWSLHHLVLHETVERGDVWEYVRQMRRAHGERGRFVARQVARALGGELLPALFPLNERVLEASLAVVALTGYVAGRARARLPGRPVLHLPHHAVLPLSPLPSRAEARAALGLPEGALILTAPGLATAAKRLDVAVRALARLRAQHPSLRLVVAGAVDPSLPLLDWARAAGVAEAVHVTGRLDMADFARHLCAADLVLALRFPTHGEMSGALARALAVGRAVLVTDGTPAAEELPAGVVVPVSPGPCEEDELVALASHLLRAPALRARVEALARQYAEERLTLTREVDALAAFLREVAARAEALRAAVDAARAEGEGLLGFLSEEVRWAARDLGLGALDLSLGPLLEPLSGGR